MWNHLASSVRLGEPHFGGGRLDLRFEWWCAGRPPGVGVFDGRFSFLWCGHCASFLSSLSRGPFRRIFRRQHHDMAADRQRDRFGWRGRCRRLVSRAGPVRWVIRWTTVISPPSAALPAPGRRTVQRPDRTDATAPRSSASCSASRCTCRLPTDSNGAAAATPQFAVLAGAA